MIGTHTVQISPSLLAADFADLKGALCTVKKSGAPMVHLDVMDGVFVRNISFGLPVIESLRRVSDLFFDTHLMLQDPGAYIDAFAAAGSDSITFHLESACDASDTLDRIHACGRRCGISIRPDTPVEALCPYLSRVDLVLLMSVEPGFGGQAFLPETPARIRQLRALRPDVTISVDGGINETTAPLCIEAGANILVAGSYFFRAQDPADAVRRLCAAR